MSELQSVDPVVIVGAAGGTNIAESLFRGANDLKVSAQLCDISISLSSFGLLNSLSWRLRDHLPPHPGRLAKQLAYILETTKPRAMVTVGVAPVEWSVIRTWRAAGVACGHFSSDDPWNPDLTARWHMQALKEYDAVFTPRRSNVQDLKDLGCRRVQYLPFGYDPHLAVGYADLIGTSKHSYIDPLACPALVGPSLFVGGADSWRVAFVRQYLESGADITLIGGYWNRWPDLKERWLGHLSPSIVAALTRAAPINLILVRRGNRDGHTMRSFEAAAIGGCLLVEDSPEHREIYGPDGEAVRFFSSPSHAAHIFSELMQDVSERKRLRDAVVARISRSGNTYSDRFKFILDVLR